jgi:hypothetical protein
MVQLNRLKWRARNDQHGAQEAHTLKTSSACNVAENSLGQKETRLMRAAGFQTFKGTGSVGEA